MKKLLALFLLLALSLSIFACSAPGGNEGPENGGSSDAGGEQNGLTDKTDTVVVPEYKDYGRGTQDFDKIVYARPNIQSLIDSVAAARVTVETNSAAVADQIESIKALEAGLNNIDSMYSVAEIYRSKDSSVEFWQTEYKYISMNYPKVTQAVEELLVACASSEHKSTFESDYFGYSLNEYVGGGIYTDDVIALMVEEARLESEYTSLSTATVEIVYDSAVSSIRWEGTVDEVLAMAKEHYKNDDASYERVCIAIDLLYEKKYSELSIPIYVDLIKVRRLIADELGYSSYSELGYKTMEYDYTAADMLEMLKDVGSYVAPVASELEGAVFSSYFIKNPQPALNRTTLINTLYDVYAKLGGDYADAYSYMLQHKLFDVSAKDSNRFNGAFTAYIDANASPFLFMTSSGFVKDYTTMSHEFGHFLDGYLNNGDDESIAVSEISSQALELLTMLKLKGKLRTAEYQYLEYYTMFSFLNGTLLAQSFYSAFEHMAYSLKYEEITKEKLEDTVVEAFGLIYGDGMSISADLSYVMMTHTVLYPFYVESYVTSGVVALDIFFAESYRTGNAGDGFKLYEALVNRDGAKLDFSERLEHAGLDSPFSDGKVKDISNNIYFQITGKYLYKQSDNSVDAA